MRITIKSPETDKEYEEYYYLRWKILRKPLNQKLGSEKDQWEKSSYHFLIKNDNSKVVAVGRLHAENVNSEIIGKIRYMAVDTPSQGLKYGEFILKALEEKALKKNIKVIYLNSREKAIGFYKKNGYKVEKKSHLLFNKVQHWLMKKNLKLL